MDKNLLWFVLGLVLVAGVALAIVLPLTLKKKPSTTQAQCDAAIQAAITEGCDSVYSLTHGYFYGIQPACSTSQFANSASLSSYIAHCSPAQLDGATCVSDLSLLQSQASSHCASGFAAFMLSYSSQNGPICDQWDETTLNTVCNPVA